VGEDTLPVTAASAAARGVARRLRGGGADATAPDGSRHVRAGGAGELGGGGGIRLAAHGGRGGRAAPAQRELCGSVQRLAWAKANDTTTTRAGSQRAGGDNRRAWVARIGRLKDGDEETCAEDGACGDLTTLLGFTRLLRWTPAGVTP